MKILIVGSNGQLGRALMDYYDKIRNIDVVGFDKHQLDISNREKVVEAIINENPQIVINSAAFTNVDGAESDYKGAYLTNVVGARNIAHASKLVHAKVLYISTDFVFDGKRDYPYSEHDATNPLSVYGVTKLAGEHATRLENNSHFIIRTSWLYGVYGNNFVKSIIKTGLEKETISVVTDQVGSPTNVSDLVEVISRLIISESYGTYHFSNKGECSWNDFAKEIFRNLGLDIIVNDITSSELGRKAIRPSYSVLDTRAIEIETSNQIRSWKDALKEYLASYRKKLINEGMIK